MAQSKAHGGEQQVPTRMDSGQVKGVQHSAEKLYVRAQKNWHLNPSLPYRDLANSQKKLSINRFSNTIFSNSPSVKMPFST